MWTVGKALEEQTDTVDVEIGRQTGMEMNRKHIAILLLQTMLTCSACGERDAKKAAFEKKRICAEIGRKRLTLDRRNDETASAGVTHAVRAEWCFSTELNTCIYSRTDDVVVTPDPNTVASIVMSMQSTIDLLTNHTLISTERVKAKRAELEEYERRRRELFSKCQ
jgi:hypothetical protein